MIRTLLVGSLLAACNAGRLPPCDCAEDYCVDAEFVQLTSGTYRQSGGGAPQVVGGIQGTVTAELDVDAGEFVLHVTGQSGEQVNYRYSLDETGTVLPRSW